MILKGFLSILIVGVLISPLSKQNSSKFTDKLVLDSSLFLFQNHTFDKAASNSSIKSLKVHAYPEKAVNSMVGEQSIIVIVQDQKLFPVPNAQVSLEIRLPFGQESRFIIPSLTDMNGLTQFAFSYNSKEIGIVEIDVIVVHEKLRAETSTSFRIWY